MGYENLRPLAGAVLSCCFLLQGCMTFREKPKVIRNYFSSHQVNGSIRHYYAHKKKMYYAEAGDPEKPVVLFIHGSPGSLSAFIPYLTDSVLLQKAFLVTADRPGFGYSHYGFGERSLDKQAAILKELIQLKKRSSPVILAGHSLAGPLVGKLAVQYPELVDGIVIIAGSIDPELEPNETWFRAPLATPFLRWMLPGSLRASNVELYHLKPQLKAMLPDWERVRCPVVVIHGKKDQLVPFGNLHFAERHLSNTTVEYIIQDDANHFIPWENPDLVNRGILHLLNTVGTKPGLISPVTSLADSTAANDNR